MAVRNISFLFGAGAENCFGIPLGDELKIATLENTKGFGKTSYGKALKYCFNECEGYKYYANTLAGFNKKLRDGDNFKQGLLDSYFHFIINPNQYSRTFSVVFNYYWILYRTITESIVKYLIDKNIAGENLKSFCYKGKLNYKKLFSEINYFTTVLYSYEPKLLCSKNTNYYSLIKGKLEQNDDFNCSGVITTNYFKFAEMVSSNIAYPNGQLKYFEYPNLLEIRDLSFIKETAEQKKLFFPFIFGQSFVKPIVNEIQVEEFHKVSEILAKTEVLIVLGYNINEDDNHLNSYLHKFLINGGKLLFVTDEENRLESLCNQLKVSKDSKRINVIKVDYKENTNEKIVESIFEKIKGL